MGKTKWEVVLYEKRNGRIPTEEFLDEIQHSDPEAFVRINNALDRLEEHGKRLDRPHVGFLRDGIRELRVRVGRTRYRILFFWYGETTCVLTHGFKKKTDRVDPKEIERAIRCRDDYIDSRRGN